ncbi:MAG: secretin N-terminal domain-containing protein [bacterium]|nr:secretin N-terminal domain-containing protein [bacterium]
MSRRIFLFIAVVFAVVNLSALGLLNDIEVSTVTGKTEVKLSLDKVANFTDFSITSPNVIVFDLIAIDNGLTGGYYTLKNGSGVNSIEIIKDFETNFLRVMVEVDDRYQYSKEYRGNDIVITVDKGVRSDIPVWKASSSSPSSKEETGSITETKSEYLITLDVENADVVTLLRGIAEYVGVNLVMSNQVTGKVTVHVKEVPWKDLFDMVTRLAGLTYDEYPNMIRVGTFTEFSKEQTAMQDALPLDIKVYKLEFAKPSLISAALRPVLSKRGIITLDDRTNSIVVKDILDVHNRIQKIIEDLDKKNIQVEIVVKVVEIYKTNSKSLGISWSLENVGYGQVIGGINLNESSPSGGTVNIGTLRDFAQINATLDALEAVGKSKTVSNPRITATNNTIAEILGGREFFVSSVGADGVVTNEKFTVGTILSVIPHVNSTKDITLEIEAELSTVTNEDLGPTINITQAKTVQMVVDGETVVMGGFVLTEETRAESGFPLLRAIPIIGHLFKNDASTSTEKEVLIFITPHIIKDIE